MIFYVAGVNSQKDLDMVKSVGDLLDLDVGVLTSYAYPKIVDMCIEIGIQNILVDSGAFTVFTKGIELDIDNYISFIKERKQYIENYFNLDVISDTTGKENLRNYYYMKDRGLDPIPVYHYGEDFEIFSIYKKECDYIGLGGLVGGNLKQLSNFFDRIFLYIKDHIKLHALGVSNAILISKYPFYSADSSTWNIGRKFGKVITDAGEIILSRKYNMYSIFNDDYYQQWAIENQISLPLPEDFDFSIFNKFNLIYFLAKTNKDSQFENISLNASLF